MVDAALKESSWRFDAVYANSGRPSIAPEKLLRALLLQVLYTVRSERLLMEQLDYNFLFRWFVGLNIDDPVWDVTVFTKNRERLLVGDVAQGFFNAVLDQAGTQGLLSNEHFTVDGTLIEAWAGHKSFKRKGDDQQTPPDDPGNPSVDFHGERRTNATHQSTTDPQARLARKGSGKEAKLCYAGQVQMDNRHGLVVNTRLTQASGTAEPEAALAMAAEIAGQQRVTLGADKGYDQKELGADCASIESRRTWRKWPIAPSTATPLANRATPSVRSSANGWKRSSAGSRPSPDCARPGIGVPIGLVGCLPSRRPPTTW